MQGTAGCPHCGGTEPTAPGRTVRRRCQRRLVRGCPKQKEKEGNKKRHRKGCRRCVSTRSRQKVRVASVEKVLSCCEATAKEEDCDGTQDRGRKAREKKKSHTSALQGDTERMRGTKRSREKTHTSALQGKTDRVRGEKRSEGKHAPQRCKERQIA